MKCNEAIQGYCANADQDGNCYNVDCEAYRDQEDTVKHTDGPWEVVQSAAGTTVKHAATKQPIASIWGNSQANASNARLIAAAPTMDAYLERKAAEGDTEAKTILNTID